MDPAEKPDPVQPNPLTHLLEEALELTRQAGEVTLGYFRSVGLAVDWKEDGTPVTQADREAERLIREELELRHPGDGILGEEEAEKPSETGRRWIIDPIDGTKAFTHGVPLYTNLLAVEDEQGIAVGVINMPALGETVYAARGLGCWCNGVPAHVSEREASGRELPHARAASANGTRRRCSGSSGPVSSSGRGATAMATPWSRREGWTRWSTGRPPFTILHRCR